MMPEELNAGELQGDTFSVCLCFGDSSICHYKLVMLVVVVFTFYNNIGLLRNLNKCCTMVKIYLKFLMTGF